jgi:hypothetical protein
LATVKLEQLVAKAATQPGFLESMGVQEPMVMLQQKCNVATGWTRNSGCAIHRSIILAAKSKSTIVDLDIYYFFIYYR